MSDKLQFVAMDPNDKLKFVGQQKEVNHEYAVERNKQPVDLPQH
jgi:hypothetical protein